MVRPVVVTLARDRTFHLLGSRNAMADAARSGRRREVAARTEGAVIGNTADDFAIVAIAAAVASATVATSRGASTTATRDRHARWTSHLKGE